MAGRIPLEKKVLSENDRLAAELALRFGEADVFVVNLMSSPGAGKTSLLEETAKRLGSHLSLAAVEGDLATDRDAERLRKAGLPARQINTGRGCHLNAAQVTEAVNAFDLTALDVLFIENVGNLVCPADFPLGAERRVVVISTTEGDDTVRKHPLIFRDADVCVINKVDLAGPVGVDVDVIEGDFRTVNGHAPFIRTNAKTGEGVGELLEALLGQV